MAAPNIQFRAPEAVVAALHERATGGESLGLAARWIIEQYLAIVSMASLDTMPRDRVVQMILDDDMGRKEGITWHSDETS